MHLICLKGWIPSVLTNVSFDLARRALWHPLCWYHTMVCYVSAWVSQVFRGPVAVLKLKLKLICNNSFLGYSLCLEEECYIIILFLLQLIKMSYILDHLPVWFISNVGSHLILGHTSFWVIVYFISSFIWAILLILSLEGQC